MAQDEPASAHNAAGTAAEPTASAAAAQEVSSTLKQQLAAVGAELLAARREAEALRAQLTAVGEELAAARNGAASAASSLQDENAALKAQLTAIGAELQAARSEQEPLRAQLAAVGHELQISRAEQEPLRVQLEAVSQELALARSEQAPLRVQLAAVSQELVSARSEHEPLRAQLSATSEELQAALRKLEAFDDATDDGAALYAPPAETSSGGKSILFNALPKSASTYCFDVVRRRAGLREGHVSVGLFPVDLFSPLRLARFAAGGRIAHHHVDASPPNLLMLSGQPIHVIIHVRDPRQALISWLHHLRRGGGVSPAVLTEAPIPPLWGEQAIEAQTEWLIEHHFPIFVRWIEGWLDAANGLAIDVLFTQFKDLVKDPHAFFARIAAHCGIAVEKFAEDLPDPRNEYLFQFRLGRIDEWRDVLTPRQAERMSAAIPDALYERFGWPRE